MAKPSFYSIFAANSCVEGRSETSCVAEVQNAVNIATYSNDMDSTVCAILNQMKEFFENYSAGDIVNVDKIEFMESDYDQSCANATTNGAITGGDETESVDRIFIGWYFVISLASFTAIIFIANACKERKDTLRDSEEIDSIKGYSNDTDSDASSVHQLLCSSVDVPRCLSETCSSCVVHGGGGDIKWIRVY